MLYYYNKKNLELKPINKHIIVCIIFVILLICTFAIISACKTEQTTEKATYTFDISNVSFEKDTIFINDTLLYNKIKDMKIKFPDIVLAQAKLESGNYTSSNFVKHNNLFGMTIPQSRATTGKVAKDCNYSHYDTWEESLYDYALWQERYCHNIKTKKEYLSYLAKNYAKDSSYIVKIKAML